MFRLSMGCLAAAVVAAAVDLVFIAEGLAVVAQWVFFGALVRKAVRNTLEVLSSGPAI